MTKHPTASTAAKQGLRQSCTVVTWSTLVLAMQLQRPFPKHLATVSTIMFDTRLCGQVVRTAPGNPSVCSKEEYKAICECAVGAGLAKRLCWDITCFGSPLFGHGINVAEAVANLQDQFPDFRISVIESCAGNDAWVSHWEFELRIQRHSLVATKSAHMERCPGDQTD